MSAYDAFGTTWSTSTDGGTTYTAVGELTKVDVLDVKVDTIETSSHDSTEQWRTFVGGMKDGGELSFEANYDPALHGALLTNVGEVIKHKIELTDGATSGTIVQFDGIVTGIKGQAPYDDKLSATFSVKVSGKPTITPAV